MKVLIVALKEGIGKIIMEPENINLNSIKQNKYYQCLQIKCYYYYYYSTDRSWRFKQNCRAESRFAS